MNTPQNSRNDRGFSLLEMIISASILLIVLGVLYEALFASNDAVTRGIKVSELQQRGQIFLDEYKREFLFARVRTNDGTGATINNNAGEHGIDELFMTFVELQYPVDHDGDGDVVDASGELEYGIVNPTNTADIKLGGYVRIAIRPEYSYRETNGPSILGIDPGIIETQYDFSLNPDSDLSDTLVAGRVTAGYFDSSDDFLTNPVDNTIVEYSLTDGVVTAANMADMNLAGDVDGDGTDDRLFEIIDSANGVLQLNVWHGAFDPTGKSFHLHQTTERIRYRNPAE